MHMLPQKEKSNEILYLLQSSRLKLRDFCHEVGQKLGLECKPLTI
jgi:hypothetical protein